MRERKARGPPWYGMVLCSTYRYTYIRCVLRPCPAHFSQMNLPASPAVHLECHTSTNLNPPASPAVHLECRDSAIDRLLAHIDRPVSRLLLLLLLLLLGVLLQLLLRVLLGSRRQPPPDPCQLQLQVCAQPLLQGEAAVEADLALHAQVGELGGPAGGEGSLEEGGGKVWRGGGSKCRRTHGACGGR